MSESSWRALTTDEQKRIIAARAESLRAAIAKRQYIEALNGRKLPNSVVTTSNVVDQIATNPALLTTLLTSL